MANNKKKDNSDAVVLLIFFGFMAVLIGAALILPQTGMELHGTGFQASDTSSEHHDFTWLLVIIVALLCVGAIWSFVRLILHPPAKKQKKKSVKKNGKKSKEELEREEVIQAARYVSEQRQRERELLGLPKEDEDDGRARRRRYSFEDEEEEEIEDTRHPLLVKLINFWERFKRMPIQGKVVVTLAAAGVAAGVIAIIANIIEGIFR